ncbi:uncharacterized protein LOC120328478 [Styela clava]|uniref:uncharacterized protein LOC120328478 n=1 Tax=Styela clava TaxID=7725 RepID=UPI00193A6E2A|nr:uncharacterized protein LOC120328478 [Styela clava]
MDNSEWRILDLGNSPLSYETARSVILDPENADKIFREVPYIMPTGGKAYIFQSPHALSKLHPKFDPYKFMFMGKGYNKEFDVMKRYYHLKHSRTDLDKQLYSFQRHIYSLTLDNQHGMTNFYLIHYFGNDYLLDAAQHRRGAPTVAEHGNGIILTEISCEDTANSQIAICDDDELPAMASHFLDETEESDIFPNHQNYESIQPVKSTMRKRKFVDIQPYKHESLSEKKLSVHLEIGEHPSSVEIDNIDYLFAMNMSAQLQQLPKEMKARVKFQIATVFYEAEIKALNCSSTDLISDAKLNMFIK